MIKIITNGRNIELTPAIKEYVEEKLGKIHFEFVKEIHVVLGVEKNPRIADSQIAEATIHVPGAVIRLEAHAESLYASIDILADKINRSLSKHKTKLVNRHSGDHAHSIRHPEDAAIAVQEKETVDVSDIDDEDLDVEITYVEN